MPVNRQKLEFFLIRALTYPFGLMPLSWIRAIGRCAGAIGFYLLRDYRKRTLSNLALATGLKLTQKEQIRYAKESFQNLAITCLEYPKFARKNHLSKMMRCENPEIADKLHASGQGIIFFCGHQSNWEVLFLEGTMRMKGTAIGKSIKNKLLYNWVLSIREQNGGKIIAPHNALREGLRALRKGEFLGIVGDQGMPNSGYSYPFLGRRAWTTTAPAILSYKANCPLIFASTKRTPKGYSIRYSDPLWPNLKAPLESETIRLMNQLLSLLQESIQEAPGEWLWQHNRWKQQTPQNVYKRFRYDSLCVILPENPDAFHTLLPHLPTLKEIYPGNFLTLLVPKQFENIPLIEADETLYYTTPKETLLNDLRFKLVFNFTDYKPVHRHYQRLSAFQVLNLPLLREIAAPHLTPGIRDNPSEIFKRALCRPGSLWHK